MILRPHHLLCMNFFVGKGYNEQFTANMQSVISKLRADPKCRVTLKCGKDVICNHCPNFSKMSCISDEKAIIYDKRVLKVCGFQLDTEYPFDFLASAVNEHIISKNLISSICSDCSWFHLCS